MIKNNLDEIKKKIVVKIGMIIRISYRKRLNISATLINVSHNICTFPIKYIS